MQSRKINQILQRLEKLEERYLAQENQVQNLLDLFKEYHLELDRRRNQYTDLLRKVGMVSVFAFGVSVPFI